MDEWVKNRMFFLIITSENKKWAQFAPIKTKNERNAPIKFPSFVYRQDGHELSLLRCTFLFAALKPQINL